MDGMTTRAVPVVKLSTTADLLAFLPTLAGVPIRNSIVVAPFEGKRASRAMRIGAPSMPTATTARDISSAVLGTLARVKRCDCAAVALYRDEPLAEIGPRWQEALGVILERLHESGYHINDAAIVASDGWVPFFDGDLDSPHPLSEIDAAAHRLPDDLGEAVPDELPTADPRLARLVSELVLDRVVDGAETDAFGIMHRADPPNPVDLLEEALAGGADNASALMLARLIAQIDSEGAVDRTVLQIAFGRETGSQSWASTLTLRRDAAEAGCAPSELMIARDEEDGEDTGIRRLGDLLAGRTHELPSTERLRVGANLLGKAIAHCALPDRSWTMCALAWIRWALGLANAAHELIESAMRVDSGNTLAPVYRVMFDHLTPDWIFHSPPPNRAERRRAMRNRS
jgi:hypothetical protein